MGFVRQFEITEGSQRFRRLFRETFQVGTLTIRELFDQIGHL